MRNKEIKFIVEVGVFSALGLALDYVAGIYSAPFWPSGGSISIAMAVIFIMGYRWGLKGGLLTGLIVGSIQILWGTAVGFLQVMLDYVLAYTVLGFVGAFANTVKNNRGCKRALAIVCPILVVCLIRTLFHVLSGVIYFETPFWASLAYNGPFMLVSTPICIVLTIILIYRYKGFFIYTKQEEKFLKKTTGE